MRTIGQMIQQSAYSDRRNRLFVLIGLLFIGMGLVRGNQIALAQTTPFPLPEDVTLVVQSNRVIVNWVYTVDPAIVTYSLERSETSAHSEATIVPAPVLSSTGDGEPVVVYYSMSDETAQPNHAYAYWLTVTNQQGETATLGPFTTGQVDDASEQRHQLFLPIVSGVS
jgi:hypothetical protein